MSEEPKLPPDKKHSRLFYHGGQIEVCLGDRVRVTRWFGAPREGIVSYIPGISIFNPDLEFPDEGGYNWAIRFSDGSLLMVAYFPDQLQPRKHIVFVERTDNKGIGPTERFH